MEWGKECGERGINFNVQMEIALCLSGGGYRASLFHLGVISMLNEIKMDDEKVMLDHVHTITSISGGALTALMFILSEIDGKKRREAIKEIYHKIVDTNIGDLLLEKFDKDSKEGRALIQSLSSIYDEQFFHGETFGKILNYMSWDGIHHFYADATDFELGLPFRFQATAKLSTEKREDKPYGMVGNWQHEILRDVAMDIKLSDIMAASSCFPIVFEPFIFPDEFSFDEETRNRIKDIPGGFPLMDGGLIDNQGVDPALHAAHHLTDEGKEVDLLLICDAGNGSGEDADKEWKLWKMSPKMIFNLIGGAGITFLAGGIFSFFVSLPLLAGILTTLSVVCGILCHVLRWLNNWLCSMITVKTKLQLKGSPIWGSSFRSIGTFFKSRAISAYRMADAVMSGNQKKLWFRALNNSPEWKERLLMNSLSLFSEKKTWIRIFRRQGLGRELRPKLEMQNTTKKAMKMDTTLWFDEEHKRNGTPKAIFACGRYTTCWNLLVFIDRLKKKEAVERTSFQNELIAYEDVIVNLWNKLQQNHYYNSRQYTD